MTSEPMAPFGFRPGPMTQGEKDHYAFAHRVVPSWYLHPCPDPEISWLSLQVGGGRLELSGWDVLPAIDPRAMLEPAPPKTARVGWVETPRPMLLWRFPLPTFTTGVLWAAWTGSRVHRFCYFTLEAAPLEGSWFLGRNLEGLRTNHGMMDMDGLESFLAAVEAQVQCLEAQTLDYKPGENHDPTSKVELILETFRAREAGDAVRLEKLLRKRFEIPEAD